MKKFLLLFGLLVSLTIQAGHFRGGSISWESVGLDKYVFSVLLHADCGGAGLPGTIVLTGPNGNISTSSSGGMSFNDTCGTVITCVFKTREYKSDTITLTGTPPLTGWTFGFSFCCRNTSLNLTGGGNYYNEATMYAGGLNRNSPKFDHFPDFRMSPKTKFFLPYSGKGQTSDSLHYSLAPVLDGQNSPITFKTNFSVTSPFPNPLTDPVNGPVYIHGPSGHIQFDVNVATSGRYEFATEIEQWQNGVLAAVVKRDIYATFSAQTNANNQPSVAIDTSAYNLQRQLDTYSMTVWPGDTARFEINAIDFDLNGSNLQSLTFTASGQALGIPWNGNSLYTSNAQLQPVTPQVGFVSQGTNNIGFEWLVMPEHAAKTPVIHSFYFRVKDDACVLSSKKIITLNIEVKPVLGIEPDTVAICLGDSVVLRGNTRSETYLWENANASFNSTQRYPLVIPSQSEYYFLKDGLSQDVVDSVYISVTESKYLEVLQDTGQFLYVLDSNGVTSFNWYFNSVLLTGQTNDTIVPTQKGTYYVTAQIGACELISSNQMVNQIFTVNELSFSSVQLYPNPAKSQVLITNLVSVQKVYLVDVTGQVHQEIRATKGQSEVLVSRQSLPSGVYFLKMEFDEGNTLVKKVVFE